MPARVTPVRPVPTVRANGSTVQVRPQRPAPTVSPSGLPGPAGAGIPAGGTDGQVPVKSGGATVWGDRVSKGELFINAADYGLLAAGTQAANATALAATRDAAAGRTIIIPPGVFYTNEVALVGPVEIQGSGQGVTTLRNATGSVFTVSGSQINVSQIEVRSDGGNHTIRQAGHVDQGHWDRVKFRQDGTGYSIWDNAGYAYVDMRITRFLSWHIQTATVPGWNLVAAGGLINDNLWDKFRAQYSGNYHFWVESTTANAQYINAWTNATYEVCTGGLIRLISVRDYIIDNGANWDMNSGSGGVTTLQRHGIYATANGSSISCSGAIRNQSRLAGNLAASIYDAVLPAGGLGSGTVIENCRNVSGANPYVADLAGNNAYVYAASTTTSLLNASGATIVSPTTGIQANSVAASTALTVKGAASQTADVLRVTDDADAIRVTVDSLGRLAASRSGVLDSAVFSVLAPDIALPVTILRGASGHTANLLEVGRAGVATYITVNNIGEIAATKKITTLAGIVTPDALTVGEPTIEREFVSSGAIPLTSGTIRFGYFTAKTSETITQLRFQSGLTAAGATPTLVRVGLYTVAVNGDLTLVASTANDTALLATASTAYTKALSVSYAKATGVRYAVGVIVVTAAAAPSCTGVIFTGGMLAETGIAPRITSAFTGQTDLPSSVASGSLVTSASRPYVVLLP